MEKQNINRRDFFRNVSAAGVGSVMAAKAFAAEPNETSSQAQSQGNPVVPRRILGKTGESVPVLSMGMMFEVIDNQIALKKGLDYGVNYWDTAHGYMGGNSEIGIGNFLKRNPDIRKKVFIVSKASGARTIKEKEERLKTSFERMNTDYVDLYYGIHGLNNPDEHLTNELKDWAAKMKDEGNIRFFGFSTHKNIEECLMAASKLDWIDAIMFSYNYGLMQEEKMQEAVKAVHEAGIGLIAMKTQHIKFDKHLEDEEFAKCKELLDSGYTEAQAKLKYVLEDERIASACVGRGDIGELMLNVAAVLDKTKLTAELKNAFKSYAQQTCNRYCAGCGHICENATAGSPPISEALRYLMYHNGYGEQDYARQLFAQLPASKRNALLKADYSLAEAKCPNRIPIGRYITKAVQVLA